MFHFFSRVCVDLLSHINGMGGNVQVKPAVGPVRKLFFKDIFFPKPYAPLLFTAGKFWGLEYN
ncbi:hypothetical protein KJ865_16840, partial [Myxococcota bacterium]|nr:hypothetical protein [Myxococcota bacterium]